MPLRTSNNSTTDIVLLTAMGQVAVGYPTLNTVLGTTSNLVYVQREYDMLNTGSFPALLLQAGTQNYIRMSSITYAGQFTALIDYYNRYDETSSEFDDIRIAIAADLELIKSNCESNESLTIGSAALAVSLVKSSLSPYAGILRDYNALKLVYRRLTLVWNILDYDTH